VGDSIRVGFGLVLIKVVSVLISGLGVWLGGRIAWYWKLRPQFVVTVAGFLAIEHHQMLWGAAGMETQIAVTLLLFSVWCLLNQKPIRTGISLGLCLLVRPDFVIWVVIALGVLGITKPRERRIGNLLRVGLSMLAIYGPWLLFTTIYYGSPSPNTIVAKFNGWVNGVKPSTTALESLHAMTSRCVQLFATLGTYYGGNGTGFMPILNGRLTETMMVLLLLVGGWASLRRRDLNSLPTFLFIGGYCAYCAFLLPFISSWYAIPPVALGILGAVYGADALVAALPSKGWQNRAGMIFAAGYLAVITSALFITIPAEKHVQQYVENGVRRRIGEYLHGVTGPNDSIGCEALGYFGYYSRRRIYEFPGLANRQVTEFLRDHPEKRRLDYVLEHFRPTYIVLRRREFDEFTKLPEDAWLLKNYTLDKEFSVTAEGRARLLAPERNADLSYLIFRRNS
jgi:hypothetical protein